MTNGEKMRADFPDIEMWGESKDTLDYSLGGMIHRVTKRWWNAEYKEPRKGQWLRMEDAISREAVIKAVDAHTNEDGTLDDDISVILEDLPPVNPQPKTGHWISHYDEDAKEGWYECDRCHTERAFNTDYCPDCGAKMVEPQERSEG